MTGTERASQQGSTAVAEPLGDEAAPLVLRLRPVVRLTDSQLARLSSLNPDLRIERTEQGELVIMSPASSESGAQNADIGFQLKLWVKGTGTGVAFDSSAGFRLPNGAVRSPDASWVPWTRLAALTPRQKRGFLPLCPDFVIELRSPSDPLRTVHAKMREYIENGAQLGWLIDPVQQQVYVYRPNAASNAWTVP